MPFHGHRLWWSDGRSTSSRTDSRVVDPVTLEELPPGEVGEIVTRGPMVFRGYWKNPEATAAAFVTVGGRRYFRTGDLGHMDAEGYFFITDRLKRMINASGFKVWHDTTETDLPCFSKRSASCIALCMMIP